MGNPVPYTKGEVRKLLPELEVIDGSEGGVECRPTTPTQRTVNYKQLQQEIAHSEEVFRQAHDSLSSRWVPHPLVTPTTWHTVPLCRFSEVFSQLDDLTTAPPPSGTSPSSRPLSRCRSRIADARSFAAQQL